LAPADKPGVYPVHEIFGSVKPAIVVRRHGRAIGTRAMENEQIADLGRRKRPRLDHAIRPLCEYVSRFAERASEDSGAWLRWAGASTVVRLFGAELVRQAREIEARLAALIDPQ